MYEKKKERKIDWLFSAVHTNMYEHICRIIKEKFKKHEMQFSTLEIKRQKQKIKVKFQSKYAPRNVRL